MSEFYTKDEVRTPSIDDQDEALDTSARAEDELSGSADLSDNSALKDSMSNTAYTGTSGNDAIGGMGGDRGNTSLAAEPLNPPISAGSVPNSTMEADLGPAPAESFTNTGKGGGDASISGGAIGVTAAAAGSTGGGKNKGKKGRGAMSEAATGVNANEPISEEPLSEVTMPYNHQPENTKPEPVALADIDVKGTATQAVSAAKEQTTQAVSAAKDAAGQALGQAKTQVINQLGSQKDRAADQLAEVNQMVQQFGATFRQNNLPQIAEYTDTLAQKVDQAAGYIKNNDVDVLLRDAERFARQNAGAFLLGGLILGVAFGRFLKSSERGMAYTGEKNALVPVGQMDAYGNMTGGGGVNAHRPVSGSTVTGIDKGSDARETERKSVMSDDSIEPGHKPMHAQDYVPGGVMGGAPA